MLDGGDLPDLAQVMSSRSAKNLSSLAEDSKTNQVGWPVSKPKGVIGILQLSIYYNSCT